MKNNSPYSRWVLVALMLLMVVVRLTNPRWATFNTQAILSWDVLGYYLYLPATLLYGDLTQLAFMPDILETYKNTGGYYQAFPLDNGNFVLKYPMGLALCYFPFFLLGDFGAFLTGHAHDGFSAPYQFAIGTSPLVFAAVGLHYLRKLLLSYFDDKAIALALIWLVLGTNYLQYVSLDGAMPHGYLFTFYCLILFLTVEWHKTQELKHAVLLGLLIGWVTIIRPTEVVVALVPLLWGIYSWNSLKQKVALVRKNYLHVIALGVVAALVISLQLIYWKVITGNFLFYSYEDQGFDWDKPHFFEVLLGFRKGLFVYTPLAILGFLGMFFLYKKVKTGVLALSVFYLVNLYIVCSWSIWWYSGSYSCRALVQSYPVLIFGSAAFFSFFIKTRFRVVALLVILMPLIAFNVKQLWQYNKGIIDAEAMTKHYFYAIVGKIIPDEKDLMYLDVKHVIHDESVYSKTLIEAIDFEEDSLQYQMEKGAGKEGTNAWVILPENPFSPRINIPLTPELQKPDQWIKATVRFKAGWSAGKSWLVVNKLRGDEVLVWRGVRLHHMLTPGQTWNVIYFYYPIPTDKAADKLQVFVQNDDNTRFIIDELKAELMVPK